MIVMHTKGSVDASASVAICKCKMQMQKEEGHNMSCTFEA